MDMYSSGEEILIKSRKPYTISKQRERWTEEEHNGFLEALKLYGRAWQRIEEHIGTKTAVQIRSHAQKFFLKLEKDATGKGVLISEVSDIDIPPPRPKKKPNHPYPRKINVPAPTVPVEGNDRKIFIPVSPQLQDKSLQKLGGLENAALASQDSFGSDILGISLAPPCTSFSCEKPTTASTLGILKFACANNEYAHLVKKVSHEDEFMNEPNQHLDNAVAEHTAMRKNSSEITDLEILQLSPDSVVHRVDSQTCYTQASTEATQRYPGKISVQAVGSSQEPVRLSSQPVLYQLLPDQPVAVLNCSDYLASSYTAATREPSSNPPITSSFASSEDGHRSHLQFSSAFSNMIVSTLQQNPAAHATASVAAASSYFPNVDIEAPEEYSGGFPARIIGAGGASPSTTAITAATVAAATAWWASIGVFPFCGLQQSVTHNQSCFTTNNDTGSVTNEKSHQDPTNKPNQPAEVVDSPMFPRRNSAFNPVVRVPAKSEESLQLALITTVISNAKSATTGIGIQGSKASSQDRKQVERSSSGSNTNSGTELETDVLEKHDRGNEESNAPDDMHSVDDSSNRRCKIAANINDSWKEVSQEGRVAFRALFSRQVLPQKFVSLHTDSELKKLGGGASPIDLNMAVYGYCSTDHQVVKPSAMERGAGNEEGEGLHYIGLGKLITPRTGFKPYKRCSIEAKDTSGCSQGKEKRPRSIVCSEGGEVST